MNDMLGLLGLRWTFWLRCFFKYQHLPRLRWFFEIVYNYDIWHMTYDDHQYNEDLIGCNESAPPDGPVRVFRVFWLCPWWRSSKGHGTCHSAHWISGFKHPRSVWDGTLGKYRGTKYMYIHIHYIHIIYIYIHIICIIIQILCWNMLNWPIYHPNVAIMCYWPGATLCLEATVSKCWSYNFVMFNDMLDQQNMSGYWNPVFLYVFVLLESGLFALYNMYIYIYTYI